MNGFCSSKTSSQVIVPGHVSFTAPQTGRKPSRSLATGTIRASQAALDLLERAATTHVVFLERDFAVGPTILKSGRNGARRRVKEVLDAAQALLEARSAGAMGEQGLDPSAPPVERVLLRHTHAAGRGFGGLNRVCSDEGALDRAFFPPDVEAAGPDDRRRSDLLRCLEAAPLDRFETATSAVDFCPARVKRDTRFANLVAECGAEATEALCYGGEISHWTNTPWMARRQWLLET